VGIRFCEGSERKIFLVPKKDDPMTLKELAETYYKGRPEENFYNSLVPPLQCKDDRELLEQIARFVDEDCEPLTVSQTCESYVQRLSFSLMDISYKNVASTWMLFLEKNKVILHPFTNMAIGSWYKDVGLIPHALAVHDHFFRQLSLLIDEKELDFSFDELAWMITDSARDYATLARICPVKEQLERQDALIDSARVDLKERYGEDFTTLNKETRTSLAKANTVILSFPEWPELVPFYFQRAVESEFNATVYPKIKNRLPKFEKSGHCDQDKCNKYRYCDSVHLSQINHYLGSHWRFQEYSTPSIEKRDRHMKIIKMLTKDGGKARHGKSEPYTQPDMLAFLNGLDGDKEIVKVLTWFKDLSVNA